MRFFLLVSMTLLHVGCAGLELTKGIEESKAFSCEEKAKPKSLLAIEQQYRCTSK